MTNQTPIEEATGCLEARRCQNAILRQEDCAPIDTIHGKPLTARAVDALLEQIKLDEQRLTELRRQLEAAEAQPCDHDSTAFEALERLHARIHRDFNFDAGESAPPTEDEPALRMMDDLVAFADEVYLPLADATKVPNPLESVVTEALADTAATPADPDPAPTPPWLVEAGDD